MHGGYCAQPPGVVVDVRSRVRHGQGILGVGVGLDARMGRVVLATVDGKSSVSSEWNRSHEIYQGSRDGVLLVARELAYSGSSGSSWRAQRGYAYVAARQHRYELSLVKTLPAALPLRACLSGVRC